MKVLLPTAAFVALLALGILPTPGSALTLGKKKKNKDKKDKEISDPNKNPGVCTAEDHTLMMDLSSRKDLLKAYYDWMHKCGQSAAYSSGLGLWGNFKKALGQKMQDEPFKFDGFEKSAVLTEACTGCWLRRAEQATGECKAACLTGDWSKKACMDCVVKESFAEFEPCIGTDLYERMSWTAAVERIEAEEKRAAEKKAKKKEKKKRNKTAKKTAKEQ